MKRPESDSSDAALEQALDGFLDWAEEEEGLAEVELPVPRLTLAEGTWLGGYELLRRLDTGGMGVVYEARGPEGPVAIKVLRDLIPSPQLGERFRREVETIAALEHPGIVPMLDAGVAEGMPYCVMPLLEGMSAANLARRLRASGGVPALAHDVRAVLQSADEGGRWGLSYSQFVAAIGADVAEALQHAHERGVVHRDVKPGNVMVTPEGRAILLDFGLAQREEADSLTRSGDFLGTLAYAAPEQLRGEEADGRSDVYGLGATLHELLSLRPVIDARSRAEVLRRVHASELSPLGSWVPQDLRAVCSHALAYRSKRRYTDAGAMARDLRAFVEGDPVRARVPGPAAHVARFARRYPQVATGVVVFLAVVALAVGHAFWLARGHVRAAHTLLGEARLMADAVRTATLDLVTLRFAHPLEGDSFREFERDRVALDDARAELEATLRRSERRFRTAADLVPWLGSARRGLTDLAALELEGWFDRYGDVYRSAEYLQVEERLREFDPSHPLLQERGSVHLRCSSGDARLRVASDHEPDVWLWEGSGELALDDVPSGAYVARIEAPGAVPASYPFLVRRRGVYRSRPEALPPRELEIELLADDVVPDGYLPILGGWTLLGDDPPRVGFVEGFAIQEHEATAGEWVEWLNWCWGQDGPERKYLLDDPVACRPRYDDSDFQVHLVDGTWVHELSEPDRYPVRGLSFADVDRYMGSLHRYRPTREATFFSLPTRDEWVRAARGADARPFPWGEGFAWRRAGLHPSRDHLDAEPEPYPILAFPDDRSPFGVHDLAGSVAEMTLDPFHVIRDERQVCGGSYRSIDPREARVTALRRGTPQVDHDVGFRHVVRRIPARLRPPDVLPTELEDDFERPDGAHLGRDWRASTSKTLPAAWRAPSPGVVRLSGGRLVLQGGVGNYSDQAIVLHPLAIEDGTIEFTAKLCLSAEVTDSTRAFAIDFVTGFTPDDPGVTFQFDMAGQNSLFSSGEAQGIPGPPLSPGEVIPVRIVLSEDEIEVSLGEWSATWDLPGARPRTRFLALRTPNLIGGRMEVETLAVRRR